MAWRFEREAIEYADLGFDVIPLAPGTKRAIAKDWQTRAPLEMWELAPNDSNIGLRCGGDSQLCVFDADDDAMPGTSQSIAARLASFGIYTGAYPSIATPSGGRHFYLRLAGDLPGHARHYRADFGAGEFRYGCGAYVGAPPSVVEGNAYKIIGGDLRTLPRIEIADVLPILANQTTTNATTHATPSPSEPLTIPTNALELLQGNWRGKFFDRSRAEASIVQSLVNAGFDFDVVLSLFITYPCAGKFKAWNAKNPDTAISQYLYPTFLSAQRIAEGSRIAQAATQWAIARAWCGKTGATDRDIFLAHCQFAHQAGRIEYHASCRELAQRAQVSAMTASAATHRLIDAGLLVPAKLSDRYSEFASVYRLGMFQDCTLSNPVGSVQFRNKHHDAFRARGFSKTFKARGLGKSASMVWELLKSESLTPGEIVKRTGRGRTTVWRVLNRMARIVDNTTGEIIKMVDVDDAGKWRACADVDLDRIANALGTFGGNEWQRAQHARERREHREQLKQGAASSIGTSKTLASRGNDK